MIHSNEITYKLHKLIFLMDKRADKTLQEKLDLTFSQFRILIAIDHQTVCQKDIANYWDMTEAAVSRQVDIMVEAGLIDKEENEENRRRFLLKLSDKGKKNLKDATELIDSAYEKIYSVVNQEERKVLGEALHKLLDVLCPQSGGEDCKTCKS